ncbi:GNAT family protein [Glutamicibacter sp.]|uniref:GNAT family N-acetyltransferase n=1 Tax=Glutamicibacter sp. TaxID=1931995 RepID=UPI0028BE8146|nr:GNAT family protein [Glutamicibacter sp.]
MTIVVGMETNREWKSINEAQGYGSSLLEDDAIVLRESEAEDFAKLSEWWNDPQWAVLQQRVIKPRPGTSLAQMFSSWSENQPNSGDAGFSIFEKATGSFIGHITLYGGVLPHRSSTMAVIIGPTSVGQGLGTRAVKLMTGYGFRELGLHRISLRVASFNTRALKAYEKAGFTLEGRERDSYFHDGAFHDELILGLLDREYFANGR